MLPAFEYSFRIDIHVDKPVVISSSLSKGKRQLIPIRSGTVSGALNGQAMPGGIDSQFIDPNGICRLSARYASQIGQGTVYVENNGIVAYPTRLKRSCSGMICAFLMNWILHRSISEVFRYLKPMCLSCHGSRHRCLSVPQREPRPA